MRFVGVFTLARVRVLTSGPTTSSTCYTLSMFDSFGDGWNGNTWHWIDASGVDTTGTLAGGTFGTAQLCFTGSGCHTFYVDTSGSFQGEVSWTITGSDGSTVVSGYADNVQYQACPSTGGGVPCVCGVCVCVVSSLVKVNVWRGIPWNCRSHFGLDIVMTQLGVS